jgi:acyl-CoA hydrolase
VPGGGQDMERRFLGPAADRLFGKYPGVDYVGLLHKGTLPANIQLDEFFFPAGRWLGNALAQQSYIPANYTHALQCILDRGVNVLGQLVAARATPNGGREYSLSCNPDLSLDVLKARAEGRAKFVFAVQVNGELPFMGGDALVSESQVDFALEGDATEFELFSVPKKPVSLQEQAIGLHAARLLRDGGTLQIGIGAVGDAVSHALILRHTRNADFRRIAGALGLGEGRDYYNDGVFDAGIYGVSEMFVGSFLELYKKGVLKREAGGALLHGGFFADTRDFYRALREMPEAERARFQMKPVSFTNSLYGDEDEKRKARVKATFINTAMMATLHGSVISDALDDSAVVSGVGGQYNFAEQAFALRDARFVITLNATRMSKGKTVSNILWKYGHETIPWHLRDTIITEYGIASLRGESNADGIASMLEVTDARFQDELLGQAKEAGQIPRDYEIPARFLDNHPERIEKALRAARRDGLLPEFPFGTDFTPVEQRLLPALEVLKQNAHSPLDLAALILRGLAAGAPTASNAECLARMGFAQPKSVKEKLSAYALHAALIEAAV